MTFKLRAGLLSATLAAGLAFSQAQPTTPTSPEMGDQGTLQELCQIHQQLGHLILRLGDTTLSSTTTGDMATAAPMPDQPMRTWTQEQGAALTQARTDLEALRANIDADELDEATRDEVTRIRDTLRTNLEGATGQDLMTADEIDALFEDFSAQAGEGQTDQYRMTYGTLLERLGGAFGQATGQQTAQQADQPMGQQAGQQMGTMRSAETICRELGVHGMMQDQAVMQRGLQQQQAESLGRAFTDLEALRERVEAGDVDTAAAVESIREGLRVSFEGVGDQDRMAWEETDLLLGQLTDQLREGREEYRTTYQGALDRLGQTSAEWQERFLQDSALEDAEMDADEQAQEDDAGDQTQDDTEGEDGEENGETDTD